MTPKCCQNCPWHLDPSACARYTRCAKWRCWFRGEWNRIQRAASYIKAQQENQTPNTKRPTVCLPRENAKGE